MEHALGPAATGVDQATGHPECGEIVERVGNLLVGGALNVLVLVWASALRLAGGQWRGPAPAFDDRLWLAAGEHRTGIDLVLLAGAVEVRGAVSDVRGHATPATPASRSGAASLRESSPVEANPADDRRRAQPIALVDAGAAPRQPLRYRFTPGTPSISRWTCACACRCR